MGKSRRGAGKAAAGVVAYDSDDGREKVPDPQDEDFYFDEVDQFHGQRDKILLQAGAQLEPAASSSEDEEVLPVGGSDDSSDDDEIVGYKRQLKHLRHQGVRGRKLSDDEGEEEEDEWKGIPDEKAWGKKRFKYYGADADEADLGSDADSGEDVATLEEKEALAIQRRLAAELDDTDFGFDIFESAKAAAEASKEKAASTHDGQLETDVRIDKDLSKLSKKEKLQLLKKDSPELFDLVEDFEKRHLEMVERLLPLQRLVTSGAIPLSGGATYLTTKLQLCSSYCTNIAFYLMLKAKHTAGVHSHPVIQRIVQHRNLLKQFEAIDAKIKPQMDKLLEKLKKGETIEIKSKSEGPRKPQGKQSVISRIREQRTKLEEKDKQKKRKLAEVTAGDSGDGEEIGHGESDPSVGGRSWDRKKAKSEGRYETKAERDALLKYQMLKSGRSNPDGEEEVDADFGGQEGTWENVEVNQEGEREYVGGESEKRAITYEMAKNKGLTPKRKKENRNPRVKHRMKYRRANIRRRGQIREVRTETSRYAGEMSGIRAAIKRSVRLK